MSLTNFSVMGIHINLFVTIVTLIIGAIIACHTLCGCTHIQQNKKEGFMGAPIGWNMSNGVPGDRWNMPPMSSSNAMNSLYASLQGHKGGPVPLPKGQLFMWAQNQFKPDCCFTPQQYSSSTGCACISPEQMKYISSRGGNNTLP
tara:strand:- start:470 stop:904 length:435 start_codon:yes stop_codon:yes gene_type:complete